MRPVLPILLLLLFFFPLPGTGAALEITALTPAAASTGEAVAVSGGPFNESARVILGEVEIVPDKSAPRTLLFTVPSLPPGDYALAVRQQDKLYPSPFILHLREPTPEIAALNPANLDECADEAEHRVTVDGTGILPGALVLLDGAVVPSAADGGASLYFTVPILPGGLHEVKVVNPGGTSSLPRTLTVSDIPVIYSVQEGPDRVNTYELHISGKNFRYVSALSVNGLRVTSRSGGDLPTLQGEYLEYIDCRNLIYHRYPYSGELKRVSLQVINPGGRESPVYHVSIP
ncbi:MAG TPA: IPT/TIG domain-containing protein [Deferrimonas sp.]